MRIYITERLVVNICTTIQLPPLVVIPPLFHLPCVVVVLTASPYFYIRILNIYLVPAS